MRQSTGIAIILLLSASTSQAQPATSSTSVRVPGGVYALGEREAYISGFTIDAVARAEGQCDAGKGHRLPSIDERLAAAQQAGFVDGRAYEATEEGPRAGCDIQMAVVEAEGVGGHLFFVGSGRQKGESDVVEGKGAATVIRIHANPWHFWGDKAKPAPRKTRCVTNTVQSIPRQRFIHASTLNVRDRRSKDGKVVHQVQAGDVVTLLHDDGAWSYVVATKEVYDDSGESGPTWHRCQPRGWVKSTFLKAKAPDVNALVRSAERHLAKAPPTSNTKAAKKHLQKAVAPVERSAALLPHNVFLQARLADVYRRVKSKEAASTAKRAQRHLKHSDVNAYEPADATLQLATWCDGPPSTSKTWSIAADVKGEGRGQCLLKWTSSTSGNVTAAARGFMSVDPQQQIKSCDPAAKWSIRTASDATHLFVRVPAVPAPQPPNDDVTEPQPPPTFGVHVASRRSNGGRPTTPWRTVLLDTTAFDRQTERRVKLSLSDVLDGAVDDDSAQRVQVRIEVFPLSTRRCPVDKADCGQGTSLIRYVDVAWPLDC